MIASNFVDICIAAASAATVVSLVFGFVGRQLMHSVRREVAASVTTAVDKLKTDIEHRFDINDNETRRAAETVVGVDKRLVKIEAQFGPNGGGMREAVDKMSRDVTAVRTEQNGQAARFEDHLKQSAEDRARLTVVEQRLMNGKG